MAADEDQSIALGDFLSAPSHPQLQSQIDALPPICASRVLLSGVPRSGKTSMLFHLSCRAAARGRTVVWLAPREAVEAAAPAPPPGMGPRHPALRNVAFKYASDLSGVKRYGAALHLLPRAPDVVVVDGLSDLAAATRTDAARGSREAEITKALALLVDALDHAREASGGHAPLLIVSDAASDDGGGPRGMYLLGRWFDAVLCATGSSPDGLVLRALPASARHVPPQLAAARLHYALAGGRATASALSWAPP